MPTFNIQRSTSDLGVLGPLCIVHIPSVSDRTPYSTVVPDSPVGDGRDPTSTRRYNTRPRPSTSWPDRFMLFDPATAPRLRPWLVRTLEPICDAEPGALADYILALLNHNAPENDMRKELVAQLEEFLEKECSGFVDTLFAVLRTKSYLPYAASPPSPSYPLANQSEIDTGIPIPFDGLISPSIPPSTDRTRKRSIGDNDRDLRPSAKGPRISNEGQFSRYPNGDRSTGAWGGRHGDRHDRLDVIGNGQTDGMNNAFGMNSLNNVRHHHPSYRPPDQKRGICRDYHNNGYCARGALCKFSHGDDAVVPSQFFSMAGAQMSGLPFMPIFPNGDVPFPAGLGAGVAYDPHEAQMDMRPPLAAVASGPRHRAPLLPRVQGEDGAHVMQTIQTPGELPVIQDLTPNRPPSATPVRTDASESFGPIHEVSVTTALPVQIQSSRSISGVMDGDTPMPIVQPTNSSFQNGRGRGRGHFTGQSHSFQVERRNDKTLVVEKIPDDKLSLDAVNNWFKKFGTVTNVAVDASNAKALVSFSKHEEAHAAWKSEDAIFNNRFVKVFWHRPMEGHGQMGARMLAASAPLVAGMASKGITTVPSTPSSQRVLSNASSSTQLPTPVKSSAATSALAAKQRLLEHQIAEQKSLMAKLPTASADEKKLIMAKLRKLGEEMQPSADTATTSTTQKPTTAVSRPDVHEQKEKERLDRELEMHHSSSETEGDTGKSTEDLKAKLEKLKAEAVRLGISDATGEPLQSGGSYRPYRGRGRGTRGYYRGLGRGAMPRGSLKLDNRPKKLLIQGATPENIQAIRDWYETTSQLDTVEPVSNGDIIVTFRSRGGAEQGLSKGNDIPPLGSVSISWYPAPQGGTSQAAPTPARSSEHTGGKDMGTSPSPLGEVPASPRSHEEEVVTSGWGGDDADDGDGMGML